MFKIRFGKKAEQEANDIQDYYESLRAGLGDEFTDELEKKTGFLRQHPEMYAEFVKDIRKGNLSDFPYSFYYMNDMPEELVNVLAVFAQARDPEKIVRELRRRKRGN